MQAEKYEIEKAFAVGGQIWVRVGTAQRSEQRDAFLETDYYVWHSYLIFQKTAHLGKAHKN